MPFIQTNVIVEILFIFSLKSDSVIFLKSTFLFFISTKLFPFIPDASGFGVLGNVISNDLDLDYRRFKNHIQM